MILSTLSTQTPLNYNIYPLDIKPYKDDPGDYGACQTAPECYCPHVKPDDSVCLPSGPCEYYPSCDCSLFLTYKNANKFCAEG